MLNTILFISSLGFPEWIVIFGVIILLFGGKKIREFNSARASLEDEFKQGMRDDDRKSNNTNSAPTTKSEPEA